MRTLSINRIYEDNIRFSKKEQADRSQELENPIIALIICKENYKALARTTRSLGLKAVCNLYAAERTGYAYQLYRELSVYGGLSAERNDVAINGDNPSWLGMEQPAGKGDAAMLNTIIASESAAIKNYETYLSSHIPPIKHLQLLTGQIRGIKQAIKTLS